MFDLASPDHCASLRTLVACDPLFSRLAAQKNLDALSALINASRSQGTIMFGYGTVITPDDLATALEVAPPPIDPPIDPVEPPVEPPIGNFQPPNIVNATFATGWDGFTDWTGANAPSGVTRVQDTAGVWSVKRAWVPTPNGDGGAQMLFKIGGTNRVYLRMRLTATAPINTIMKFARFYDTNFATALGGFFMSDGDKIFNFGTDQENGAITTWFGLNEPDVVDGREHSLELDYWRNGDASGFPSAAFYFDGVQVAMPDGNNVQYPTSGNASYWKGGRLYSGERKNTQQVGYIEMLATLNEGCTTTGQVNMFNVAISTVGRIGP